MSFLSSPLIAAGIQAGGSLLGGMFGAQGQSAANAQQFAQQEMLFDQQQSSIPASQQYAMQNAYIMRGNAYQTAMGDMAKAGLNPILAAGTSPAQGGVSSGMSVNPPSQSVGNPGAFMAQGMSSAAQAAQTYSAIKSANAQADRDTSQSKLNDATGRLHDATTDNTKLQNANITATGDNIRANTQAATDSAAASRANATALGASAALDSARTVGAQYDAQTAKILRDLKQAELDRVKVVGSPAGGPVGRTVQDLGGIAEQVGTALSNAYHGAIDLFRSGQGPQAVAPHSAKGTAIYRGGLE